MELGKLIENLPIRHVAGPLSVRIGSVVEDSRRAGPGSLFVARAGENTDGRRHIADAVGRGAVGVIFDRPPDAVGEFPAGVAILECDDLSETAVTLANRFHEYPGSKLRLIGVTGTNGKTTTVWMIRHLLSRAGLRCGMIGTVEVDDARERRPAELTTPQPVDLIGMLGAMVRNGCGACVMEVSSHALDLGRVRMLRFDGAVFTNLSGDHLDYHGTMERYAAAKAMLFESIGEQAWAVVNADDPASGRMVRDCAGRVVRFGLNGAPVEVRGAVREATAGGTALEAVGPWGAVGLRVPLIGGHNVSNLLGALGAADALGVEVAGLGEAVAACPPVPGRLEPVEPGESGGAGGGASRGPRVLVDYAHTDDALANVLRALRLVTRGRLRVLFGCGGDRDASKRPRMGAVAAELADDLVITSDNPRTEDPMAIVEQIMAGVPPVDRGRVLAIADRGEAIERIVADAGPDDVVLLAGKGHEDYQIVGTERRAFDDREVAGLALGRELQIEN